MSNDVNYVDSSDAFESDSWDGNAFAALIKNKTVSAVAASAILALSGASASQIADYSGTNYTGTGSCQSYNVSTWADPHLTSIIGGQQVATGGATDIGNFSTVYNTAGGETNLAVVTGQNQNEYVETWNKSSTLTHSGPNGWTLSVTTPDGPTGDTVIQGGDGSTYIDNTDTTGQILGTITTASGSQAVYDGETLPDGSKISYSQNQALTITQPLNQGGSVTTTYTLSYATDSSAFLNIAQSASGAAIVNGAAFDLADASTYGDYTQGQPLLTVPCSAPNPNAGAAGNVPGTNSGSGGAPEPGSNSGSASTPVPGSDASSANAPATGTGSGNTQATGTNSGSNGTSAPAATPAPTPVPTPTPKPPALDTTDTTSSVESM